MTDPGVTLATNGAIGTGLYRALRGRFWVGYEPSVSVPAAWKMKDPVLAVITRLKADAGVAAVVGTRVYRATLPVSPTFPAISVSRVSNIRPTTSHSGCGYATSRIQCTAWAASDGEADNLSELIANSLNRVTSTNLSPGVYVISIFDGGATSDPNPEQNLWAYHRDFVVRYGY